MNALHTFLLRSLLKGSDAARRSRRYLIGAVAASVAVLAAFLQPMMRRLSIAVLGVVISLAVLAGGFVAPAQAAPIYTPVNPGTDFTVTMDVPFSTVDLETFSSQVMARSLGLPAGAPPTRVAAALEQRFQSLGPPPSSVTDGASPVPSVPTVVAAATSVTIQPTSSTTSRITAAIPQSTISNAQQDVAGIVGFGAGEVAMYAGFGACGLWAGRGLPTTPPEGQTMYQQFVGSRPGALATCNFMSYGISNIVSFAVNDRFLGASLHSGIWAGVTAYAALSGLGGVLQPYLVGWDVTYAGRFSSWVISSIAGVFNSIVSWFSAPQAASDAIHDLAQGLLPQNIPLPPSPPPSPPLDPQELLAITNDLLQQLETLVGNIGVNAMDVGGFIHNTATSIGGQPICLESRDSDPLPGTVVQINTCNGQQSQYWRGWNVKGCAVADWGQCEFKPFQLTLNGLCLAPVDEYHDTLSQNLTLAWCDGNYAQEWEPQKNSLGNFPLVNEFPAVDAGLAVCLEASQLTLFAPVDEAGCGPATDDNKQWHGFDPFQAVFNGPGLNPGGLQMAVASYIYPTDSALWNRLIGASTAKESVLVANVLNGPGSDQVPAWANVINQAAGTGKRVLGYVDTGYLGLAPNRLTRLGSSAAADWIAQAEADVNAWYKLYGNSIGGIFFDDGWNTCGPNNQYATWYQELSDYVKRNHPGALTVINPGAVVPQCYDGTADVLLTFEGDYSTYTGGGYQDLGWTPTKSTLWHIIFGTSEGNVGAVASLAKQRGAGLVEITDGVLPNPYNTLPSDSYWSAEQAAVDGGVPSVADPTPYTTAGAPATPSLSLSGTDYSSTQLTWSAVDGASRYLIAENGVNVASIPAPATGATIGGLTPGGSSYSFTVSAQGTGQSTSGPSNAVSATTLSLPGGKSVANATASASAGSTTYTADFLLPYAFHRIYIWNGVDTGTACQGWPINYTMWDSVCAQYMVEGSTLFQYAAPAGSFTWSWTPIGSVQVAVNGYTYTFTVPIGTSTADTTKFVIQAEGYDPLTNIFNPCSLLTLGNGPDGNGHYCAS